MGFGCDFEVPGDLLTGHRRLEKILTTGRDQRISESCRLSLVTMTRKQTPKRAKHGAGGGRL